MKSIQQILLPLMIAAAGSAQAAISITTIGTTTTVDDTSTSATYSNFDLNGGNAVLLYFSGENVTGLSSVTFAGETMTVVQATGSDTTRDHLSAIAYIINPTASVGDIEFSWNDNTNNSESAHTPIALSDVGSVAGSDTLSGNLSFNYTLAADGGFVAGNASNNSFNFSSPPTVSGNNLNDDSAGDYFFYSNVSGNFSTIHAYGENVSAGSYTDTFGNSLSSMGIAFEAIPEPSTALLGGLGASLLLRRRRNS